MTVRVRCVSGAAIEWVVSGDVDAVTSTSSVFVGPFTPESARAVRQMADELHGGVVAVDGSLPADALRELEP